MSPAGKPRIRCLAGFYSAAHGFLWGVYHRVNSRRPNAMSRDIRKLAKVREFQPRKKEPKS